MRSLGGHRACSIAGCLSSPCPALTGDVHRQTNTVSSAVAIENSFTVTYGYEVGLKSDGLSVGASVKVAEVRSLPPSPIPGLALILS